MKSSHRWMLVLALFASVLLLVTGSAAQDEGEEKHEEPGFHFRFIGPVVGNRIAAIAGIAGDPNTYYAGAASGGVWKTVDGGNRWQPIFDDQPVEAIGALAVAPSDRSIVWAGTGEAWAIRDSDVGGNGVYRSMDAGTTWTHMGLDETGRIARIVINPFDPKTVFVCAAGRLTGPQPERGVYRTTDGGQHWQRVLFVNENTGCSGLSMDPQNPRTMFAGTWEVVMHTYAELSGGPGSGVYVTHDGGDTWTHIEGHGLPHSPVGKIDVAVAPTDSNRVYALIQTPDQGSVWRSDDGGQKWKVVNWDRSLIGRAGYYIRIQVSPTNENEVFVANSSFHHSVDGGETFATVKWGGDTHDIWIDPRNADRFVITDDAGLIITQAHGRGFHRVTFPIGQMYHVAVDDQVPYYVYSNMQDDGTMRGPSTSAPSTGYEPEEEESGWEHRLGGCESGFTLPDLTDPNIIWASCYGNEVTRYDARLKKARSVSPWRHTLDSPPNQSKYRCHWTPPLAIDPFDHNTVYYGCQVIFKTSNGGQTWTVISPDLSTQDPSRIISSGGIVGDNLGQFYGEVVFAIAPSALEKGLIWAGTNDGKVWYTKDGGGHWVDVTKNLKIPAWGTVSSIQPSYFDAGTAYLSVDYHLMDNRDPFIYKTTNFGQSWTLISDGIPKGPLSYVRVVAEDPNRKGLLFAGTGNALYYSLDDGGHWTNLQGGLPHATVSWVVVQKNFHDLVVSTYGRGLYILDDITPLEQMASGGSQPPVRLYTPRSAYRFSRDSRAFVNYELQSAPKKPVQIDILDSSGQLVRHIEETARQGFNRTPWDLHHDGPRLVRLRTTPPENPYIWEEPRFHGKDWRPITHWGMRTKLSGPLVVPGQYTVKLTVDDQSVTAPLEVVRDPKTPATDRELAASVKLQLRIRDDVSKAADMVNNIEWARKQLAVSDKMYTEAKKTDIAKSIQDMDQKMQKVEYMLVSRTLTRSDDKYFSDTYKVYYNLLWLNAEIGPGGGDVAGGSDYGPTDTEVALLNDNEQELTVIEPEYRTLMQQDLPAFNRAMLEHGGTPVVAGAEAPAKTVAGSNQ